MNILRIHEGYRTLGVTCGLPVFYVDTGPGMRLDPLEVVERLRKIGLDIERWVIFGSGFAQEKGSLVLLDALRSCRVHFEVEDDGSSATPQWFPLVDRWILYWTGKLTFNFGALRPKRDFIVYRGEDIEKFLESTDAFQAVKAWIVEDPSKVYEKAKKLNLRVYKDESKS